MIPVVRTYRRTPMHFNKAFNNEFYGGRTEQESPKINVNENETSFLIDVVAPGFDRNELKVSIDKNRLTISSDFTEKENDSTSKSLRNEYSKTAFSRTFELPENIEAEKTEATHKNGILAITITKKAKVEIPVQEIEIK